VTASKWSPEEVLRVASTTGKALEVRCARRFLAQNWSAMLGSYYADGALDVPRELDILAERSARLQTVHEVTVSIRAAISCRDFPDDRSPMTYSVSHQSIPSLRARLIAEHRGPIALEGYASNYGPLPSYEALAADHLLKNANLRNERHVIAFDQIEEAGSQSKRQEKVPTTAALTRMKEGDASLFRAIESAVKAAQYWRREDYQQEGSFASLTIPVLLLGDDFWDVCVDDGRVYEPRLIQKAYVVNFFPTIGGRARELLTIIWSIREVDSLIRSLDQTFAWFSSELNREFGAAVARTNR